MTTTELFEQLSTSDLIELVSECNAWNGCMENLQVYGFDEDFFDNFFHNNPMEAARATFYGDVNWYDELIRFNVYGNLESLSEAQYEEELEYCRTEILDNALELYKDGCIDVNYDIQALFDEYLESEEE